LGGRHFYFTEMSAVGAARTVRSVPGSMEKTSNQAAKTGTTIMAICMMIVVAMTLSNERLTGRKAGKTLETYDLTTCANRTTDHGGCGQTEMTGTHRGCAGG
jgi:hypothetical protein